MFSVNLTFFAEFMGFVSLPILETKKRKDGKSVFNRVCPRQKSGLILNGLRFFAQLMGTEVVKCSNVLTKQPLT